MGTPQEAAVTVAAKALSDAAKAYAAALDSPSWARLIQAAEDCAKARWAVKAPPKRETSSGLVMPFGNSKNTPIEKCSDKDLRYLVGVLEESVIDPAKERWREKNLQLLEAAKAELEAR